MLSARELVIRILQDYELQEASIEALVDRRLKESKIDRRDKRLVFEIVYGVIRNRYRLDFILETYLDKKSFLKNIRLMNILRSGVYQIGHLDRIPDHAAVNEGVKLAKASDESARVAGVVNAILRKVIQNKKNLPAPDDATDKLKRLSINYSHPEWLIENWIENFGTAQTIKLLKYNNTIPVTTVRRKMRGLARGMFESEVASISESKGKGRGFKELYYPLKKHLIPNEINLFEEGNCTVQAESSGWVVALMDLKDGEKVLDVCSAPGGKTTLISELVGKDGVVYACDSDKNRINDVVDNFFRMNLTNISPVVCDGRKLPFNMEFDKILLDAPCSGTGVINRHPDARYFKKPKHIKKATKVQKKLLKEASAFVKKGGCLVYSTCSIEPEENFAQVSTFLEENDNFVLERAGGNIPPAMVDINGCLSITPFEHNMDGMFGAILKRIK